MNILLTIASLIVFALFIIYQRLKSKRYILQTRLKSAYTKMETFAITKKSKLTEEQLLYLKTMKYITVNPQFLDMRLLITSHRNEKVRKDLKYDKKFFLRTEKSFGKDFQKLVEEFDESSTQLLVLSIYKIRFVLFLTKLLVPLMFKKYVIDQILQKGVNIVRSRLSNEFSFLLANESVLIHSTLKNYAPTNNVDGQLGY